MEYHFTGPVGIFGIPEMGYISSVLLAVVHMTAAVVTVGAVQLVVALLSAHIVLSIVAFDPNPFCTPILG